jgi:hypothetical protein
MYTFGSLHVVKCSGYLSNPNRPSLSFLLLIIGEKKFKNAIQTVKLGSNKQKQHMFENVLSVNFVFAVISGRVSLFPSSQAAVISLSRSDDTKDSHKIPRHASPAFQNSSPRAR